MPGPPTSGSGSRGREIYLRLVYGKFEPEILEGRALEFGILGAGISLAGVRATLGDALFAEVRAGGNRLPRGSPRSRYAS